MNRTYIISGNFRGGTTLATRLIEACGIAIPGPYHSATNMENREIQNILHPHHKSGRLSTHDQKKLLDLAARYTETHGSWGFKYPATHQFICSGFLDLFDNPQLVFITRQPGGVIQSEKRRSGRSDAAVIRKRTIAYNERMRELASRHRYKSILLRYEDLISNPEQECEKICNFVGRGVDTAHEIAKLVKR